MTSLRHSSGLFLPLYSALVLLLLSAEKGGAQTLTIDNDIQKVTTLANTTVTMTGKSELWVSAASTPLSGCVINLNSPDAWLFLTGVAPSVAVSTYLSQVQVNGAAAVADSNVRVVQYLQGAVIIPQASDFSPMQVFDGKAFTGPSKQLQCYTSYNDAALGGLATAISSFKLKRGYMATVAQNEVGTGISKTYVAQNGDLEVSVLPSTLDNKIRFIRIFPWRWVSKKGIAGNIESGLNVSWKYNWNIDQNSSRDLEYVPIRQHRWDPSLDQNWKTRGANHLLGYNEPDHTDQANLAVGDAIYSWPDLLGTGLRVGAPAVSDGGTTWLTNFINAADTAGLRVDFVPVHYYRSYASASDPDGATTQFYNYLKAVYDVVKRPLWVTEFNNGASWTTDPDPTAAQEQATIAKMIAMLDSTPFVERYAIYNWVEDVRRVKWDDGSLTATGVTYRDKVSPLSFVQDMPDAGIAAAAQYAFNGDLRDSTGNGNDAMAIGTPAFVAGKSNQGIALDGANDYLQVSPRLGDSTDFSFTGWVKWNGGTTWQRIFDFGDVPGRTGPVSYFFLSPNNASGLLRFAIKTTSGTEQVLTGPALPIGQWTHVAVTISGNTGKLFVNGTVVATNTSMTYNPGDIGTQLNYIGKSQFAADPLFNGQLDDLRFFATALTDAQVATIASAAPPQFTANPLTLGSANRLQSYSGTLVGTATGGTGTLTFSKVAGPAWLAVAANGTLTGVPGGGDSGTNTFVVRVTDANGATDTTPLQINVLDASGLVASYPFDGNANTSVGTANGVTTGSPTYVTGHSGSAINLDGSTNYVTLPAGVASSPEITVAGWVWWNGSSQWQRIFDFGGGTNEYLTLIPRSGSNTLRFEIKNFSTVQRLETAQLATGQWVHVAVALGSNTGRLYVNGVLADSESITLKPTDFEVFLNYIGKSQYAADPLFNGRIDDFQVFNQALSGPQIAALAAGHAPTFGFGFIYKPDAAEGEIYEQTLAGSATDPDGAVPLTFSKVKGPKWLTVSADGRISGVPQAGDAGLNRFTVRVTDATLLASEATLNITVTPATDLIAHYPFNNNTTNDIGGASATATGSPVYVASPFDNAIDLDGIDDTVQLPSGLANSLADATFVALVRWDGGNAWQRVFDFGNSTTQYFFLSPSSGTGVVQFEISNAGVTQRLQATAPLPIGEWTHVAVTLIGNTGTLYLNGASVSSGAITIRPSAIAPTLNYLGKSQFAPDPLFNGQIDDFRIYNRGLSPAEVSALAVAPAATTVPDSSYAAWAAGPSFPSGESGVNADPDGDGVPNGWEYMMGSDPLIPGSGILPQVQLATAASLGLSGDKTYLTLRVRVKKQSLGATVAADAASTVPGLSLSGASSLVRLASPVSDGNYKILTYYYNVPIEDAPTGFKAMRLRLIVQ